MIPIKVLILHYSSYGHVERMAQSVDAGVKESGAEAVIKRVPELVPALRSKFRFKCSVIANNPSVYDLLPSSLRPLAALRAILQLRGKP